MSAGHHPSSLSFSHTYTDFFLLQGIKFQQPPSVEQKKNTVDAEVMVVAYVLRLYFQQWWRFLYISAKGFH